MKVYIALSTHMFSSFLPTSLEIQHNIGVVIEVSGASQVAQWQRISLQCGRHQRCGFNPWAGKIPWRRKWQPTPVFLPGESLGQRSLEGHSPRVHKELDVTEHTQMDAKDLGKIALIVF